MSSDSEVFSPPADPHMGGCCDGATAAPVSGGGPFLPLRWNGFGTWSLVMNDSSKSGPQKGIFVIQAFLDVIMLLSVIVVIFAMLGWWFTGGGFDSSALDVLSVSGTIFFVALILNFMIDIFGKRGYARVPYGDGQAYDTDGKAIYRANNRGIFDN